MSNSAVNYSPRYTVDDYEQWEGDWELWNGVAVCMSPSPSPLHQYVTTSLAAEIREQLKKNHECSCVVINETDWCIDSMTVVRPDVSVLCRGLPAKYIDYTPALVAEVLSRSTKQKDRTAKKELYRQQGVKWYLIVDTDAKTIDVHELVKGAYTERSAESGEIALQIDDDCRAVVQLDRVLDR